MRLVYTDLRSCSPNGTDTPVRHHHRMVILCYDATAAIDRAGALLRTSPAVVPSPEVTQARAQHRRERRP